MSSSQHSSLFDDIADPVLCILGPTASGKTALACELYERGDIDIISVDSALVYRDMNIGTAKPTADELAKYPHALVDILSPTQAYSAADFVADARRLIKQSHAQGRVPVLVGGTMLYFHALFGGLNNMPAADPQVRESLSQELADVGIAALHDKLAQVDPQTAQRLNQNDTQRILRALEVFYVSGKAISEFQQSEPEVLPATWQVLGLMPERSLLHERIEQRLNNMWQAGLVDEVRMLKQKYDLVDDLPSMRSVGYRQVWQYLKLQRPSEADRQQMRDTALFSTRQLAKRQCTWLRKLKKLHQVSLLETQTQAKSMLDNLY